MLNGAFITASKTNQASHGATEQPNGTGYRHLRNVQHIIIGGVAPVAVPVASQEDRVDLASLGVEGDGIQVCSRIKTSTDAVGDDVSRGEGGSGIHAAAIVGRRSRCNAGGVVADIPTPMMVIVGDGIHALEDCETEVAGLQNALSAQRDQTGGVRLEQANVQVMSPSAKCGPSVQGAPRALGGVDIGIHAIISVRIESRNDTAAAIASGDFEAPVQVGAGVAERCIIGTGGASSPLGSACAVTATDGPIAALVQPSVAPDSAQGPAPPLVGSVILVLLSAPPPVDRLYMVVDAADAVETEPAISAAPAIAKAIALANLVFFIS
jgi:hypothetical protein